MKILEIIICILMAAAFITFKIDHSLSEQMAIGAFILFVGLLGLKDLKRETE